MKTHRNIFKNHDFGRVFFWNRGFGFLGLIGLKKALVVIFKYYKFLILNLMKVRGLFTSGFGFLGILEFLVSENQRSSTYKTPDLELIDLVSLSSRSKYEIRQF